MVIALAVLGSGILFCVSNFVSYTLGFTFGVVETKRLQLLQAEKD